MVVVCESCSTRFRIDDARIPAKGRLVRCSQCKATFIATPEHASPDEVIEEVVAEITDAGGSPVPEPADDLFDASGGDLDDPTTRLASRGDEERWEFDETPRIPALTAEPGPDPEFEDTRPPAEAVPPLEEVGDPADWDLLRDPVASAASEARFVDPVQGAVRREAEPEPFLAPVAAAAAPAPKRVAAATSGRLARGARGAAAALAWLALAGVAAASVGPLLVRDTALHSPFAPARSLPLADGEARSVRGSLVENAFGGPLYVVSGELARPGGDPSLGLRVHLVDGAGVRTGSAAWAGAAPAAPDLRELSPEALGAALDAVAAARGGRFAAVFAVLPETAAGFELALEPLPLPEPPQETLVEPVSDTASETPETPETEAPAAGPASAGDAAPTASSSPEPRPSSE